MEVKIRKPYDPVKPVRFKTTGPSLAEQSARDECDINKLLAKYGMAAIQAHAEQYKGQYGDVSGLVSFQEAQNIIAQANQMFASLPSEIRKRFGNDPQEFLNFAEDPANDNQMVAMGLKEAPVAPQTEPGVDNPVPQPEPSTGDVEPPAEATAQ